MSERSIFSKYYSEEEFIDRFKLEKADAIDVIIPVMNTNELWEKNLYAFYREIPINRLIIGNGGCTDVSIDIVKKFPRVVIIDQSNYKSLGYCIKNLIEHVETEWFVYLHADVYLPKNWFNNMKKYRKDYDFIECPQKITTLVEFTLPEKKNDSTWDVFAGSQMGKKSSFDSILPKIDDDYVYRNEDMVWIELLKEKGFTHARIYDTFHYHQVMNKRGEKEPKLKNIIIEREHDKEWEIRTFTMQAKGIIKYLKPNRKYLISAVNSSIGILLTHNALNWKEFKEWVKETNPVWLKHINRRRYLYYKLLDNLPKIKEKGIKWV